MEEFAFYGLMAICLVLLGFFMFIFFVNMKREHKPQTNYYDADISEIQERTKQLQALVGLRTARLKYGNNRQGFTSEADNPYFREEKPQRETPDSWFREQEEREKQEYLKQQECEKLCNTHISQFWNDFLINPEETPSLLARLKSELKNSGYTKWQEKFHEVEKSAKEFSRSYTGSCQAKKHSSNFGGENEIHPYKAKEPENEAYKLFGLSFDSLTSDSLKKAYHRLLLKYHPDKNNNSSSEMIQKIQRYYAYLKNELRRKAA